MGLPLLRLTTFPHLPPCLASSPPQTEIVNSRPGEEATRPSDRSSLIVSLFAKLVVFSDSPPTLVFAVCPPRTWCLGPPGRRAIASSLPVFQSLLIVLSYPRPAPSRRSHLFSRGSPTYAYVRPSSPNRNPRKPTRLLSQTNLGRSSVSGCRDLLCNPSDSRRYRYL